MFFSYDHPSHDDQVDASMLAFESMGVELSQWQRELAKNTMTLEPGVILQMIVPRRSGRAIEVHHQFRTGKK